jgi:hypothetical protein
VRALSYVLAATLTLIPVWTVPTAAQQSSPASSMFTGVNPRDIKMVQIDTTKAMKTLNVNSAFRTPAPTKPFNLGNVLPKVHLGSWPPIVPSTPVLKKNPFQPNPIFGKNPFDQTPKK